MTEGPTAKYQAIRIKTVANDESITNIETKSKLARVDLKKLIGKKIEDVETFGKNIVIIVGDYAIRLHLMMYGSIHIYSLSEKLAKPESQVRLFIQLETKKIVVYNAPIVEIDYKGKVIRNLVSWLGPDPLRKDWNPQNAIKLILKHKNRKIGDVLLDQGVIAGIGNILRNEILFRAGVHPDRLVKDLSILEVERIVSFSKELSEEFFERRMRHERIKPMLMVYNRYNKPCFICGTPIKFYRQQPNGRKTFVCEHCQK